MANYAVYNTISLRSNYGDYRAYAQKDRRSDADTSTLSFADASALRKAIKGLGSYNYEDSDDQELYDKIRALADTYNYTLDSAKKEGLENANPKVKGAMNNLKKLASEYSDELSKYGISVDGNGYMSVSDTATKNITHTKFEKILGKESDFAAGVSKYAKKITSNIDIYL